MYQRKPLRYSALQCATASKSFATQAIHQRNHQRIFSLFGIAFEAQLLENNTEIVLGEVMYGYRGNRGVISNFLGTLLAGYLVGQILPLGSLVNAIGQNIDNIAKSGQVKR
ncbi:hypothetical protein H6G63_30590 [Leptolyngbya sp. FACHB-402]|nr:hypothetical protein [Leptolyngbya sp. FACHB-161]MBD2377568.1 hypothetical protein [Leptolyngbya sp. FACHB-238]MBD2408540.1 hypothetical protein [Leptolyngbya sp. FACHB-402]